MSPEKLNPAGHIFERLKKVVKDNPNSAEIVDFDSNNLPSGMCSADRVILVGLDHQSEGTVRSVNFSIYEKRQNFSRGIIQIEYSDEETEEIYLGKLIESAGGLIQENSDDVMVSGVDFRSRTSLKVQSPLEVAREKTSEGPQIIAIFKENDQIIMANISPIQLEEIEQIKAGDEGLEEASGNLNNSLERLIKEGAKILTVPVSVGDEAEWMLRTMDMKSSQKVMLCNFPDDFAKKIDRVDIENISNYDTFYRISWILRESEIGLGYIGFKCAKRSIQEHTLILRQSDGKDGVTMRFAYGLNKKVVIDQPFEVVSGGVEPLVPVIYRDEEDVYHFTNITKKEAERLKDIKESDLEDHEESHRAPAPVVQQPKVFEHSKEREEVVKPKVVSPTVLEPHSKSVPTGTVLVPPRVGGTFPTRNYNPNNGPTRLSSEQQIAIHQKALRALRQGNKGKDTKEQIAYHRREISRLTNPNNKKPHSRRHW